MPSYFTQSDISKMSTSLPGWTLTNDGTSLTLTATTTFNCANGAGIVLGITNVYCSNTPVKGQQSTPGFVKVTVDQKSFDTPIVATASFDLVWANSQATLKWQTNVVSPLTPVGMLSGGITAYAQPGTDVMTLTTATNTSTGDVWVLGYIYNYNTSNPNQTVPQVAAAWWKQGAPKTGSNLIVGNWVNSSSSPPTTTCFNSSGSSIVINVTFSRRMKEAKRFDSGWVRCRRANSERACL